MNNIPTEIEVAIFKSVEVIFQNINYRRLIDSIDCLQNADIYFDLLGIMFPDATIQFIRIKDSHLSDGNKIQKLITLLGQMINDVPLDHISGEQISKGDRKHILNLLQLLEYLSQGCIPPDGPPSDVRSAPENETVYDNESSFRHTVMGTNLEFGYEEDDDVFEMQEQHNHNRRMRENHRTAKEEAESSNKKGGKEGGNNNHNNYNSSSNGNNIGHNRQGSGGNNHQQGSAGNNRKIAQNQQDHEQRNNSDQRSSVSQTSSVLDPVNGDGKKRNNKSLKQRKNDHKKPGVKSNNKGVNNRPTSMSETQDAQMRKYKDGNGHFNNKGVSFQNKLLNYEDGQAVAAPEYFIPSKTLKNLSGEAMIVSESVQKAKISYFRKMNNIIEELEKKKQADLKQRQKETQNGVINNAKKEISRIEHEHHELCTNINGMLRKTWQLKNKLRVDPNNTAKIVGDMMRKERKQKHQIALQKAKREEAATRKLIEDDGELQREILKLYRG